MYKKGNIVNSIKILFYTVLSKQTNSIFKQELYHSKMIPIEKEEYDIAIAYHVPASFPVVYVLNNIKARKKIAWIHSDVSQYRKHMKRYDEYYQKYDKIFCVSKYGANEFIKMYPQLKSKTDIFYNIIDKKNIDNMAKNDNGFNDKFDGIRILTVGRLTEEKGQDLIPEILDKLNKNGCRVKWYCIGDGEMRSKLEKNIIEHKLENDLILLGTKMNPYPFMQECDVYVQPSRHEGYCITLAEARNFNKPIITTDFVGAREQIIHENTGLIVKCNKDEIAISIERVIKDNKLRLSLINNLKIENKFKDEITANLFDLI